MENNVELAGRLHRLGGAILDWIAVLIITMPAMMIVTNLYFPGAMDYHEFLTIITGGLVGQDAATYLYKLVTEVLPCSLNPYNLFNNVNASIMKQMSKIQAERPDIIEKMQVMAGLPVEVQMRDITRAGFPNG